MKQIPKGNIYLTGFMGCGKTLVGRLLAERLNRHFFDTDETIVEEMGMSIPEIFKAQGEPTFRQMEKMCIQKVTKRTGYVVSLGGGAILDPENWKRISQSGITVALLYPSDIIARRLAKKTDRPLLDNLPSDQRIHKIRTLMAQREPFYKKADILLSVQKEVPAQHIVNDLIRHLGEKS